MESFSRLSPAVGPEVVIDIHLTCRCCDLANGSAGRRDGRRGPEGGSNGVVWLGNS